MKAWRFYGTNKPLKLEEVPEPHAKVGEVVVDMKAVGLCHTDVGFLTDPGWMTGHTVPFTLGHEDAGVISEVGDGVEGFKVGDRVAICPTTSAGTPGGSFDGGYGEKVEIGAQALVPIPDSVDFVRGAAATDAGMTSYHAVATRAAVKKGENVCIIGVGGLGQIGARVAYLLGANLYVAEVKESAWPMAKDLGAIDVKKSIADFAADGIKFDKVIDFAGFGTTTAQAIEACNKHGVVVLVGMGRLESTINTKALIMSQVDLRGSNGGTKEDIAGVYELMSSGKLDPVTTKIPFSEIPEGLKKLQAGDVRGRLVAVYE
ncbi:zinc-binding dehydrogenase [Bifidobacterium sp. ESL0690]|uniref:zinc-binding dehydrogenase n=1 Tax=Bifidobacterium sp. ESL0690 TaxID=2983214 RepID=UPI0023F79595|nr:zinc-binding dehydrogenase [Bifidobacterium sp. ESL0690]WEV47283.1 zinc-binding dehydrogenase [Bifidobacterium sp. ESL0690]